MKRKITAKLVEWKNKKEDRKPLLLYGARQVGKTYIIQDFADRFYKNSLYINFEKMPLVGSFFDSDISPARLIKILESHFDTKIVENDTLLIFDEIQICERALTSLKYFAEEAQNIHIIAAGSLMGVAINREKYSFPVGKVEMLTLYPLNFEEFLMATGKSHFIEIIQEHYIADKPMSSIMHTTLLDLHKRYLAVGGMPVAVKSFVNGASFSAISEMQSNILNAYSADMSKYASQHESVKIRGAYDSIPAQLAKINRKFQYKLIRKGASTALFGSSIEWIVMSGVVLKCDKVERGTSPLPIFRDLSSFKLYMSDTGLYCAKASIAPKSVIEGGLNDVLKGAISENCVAQTLIANGFALFYWESHSQAEVDFVIQKEELAIPIEVKYDINTRSKSLNSFIKKYNPPYAIRVSAKNFGFENRIKSVPHYAVFCIVLVSKEAAFLAKLFHL